MTKVLTITIYYPEDKYLEIKTLLKMIKDVDKGVDVIVSSTEYL